MPAHEWPAEDYAIGSYIQASIASHYLHHLALNPQDRVLDVGCGNGAFSRNILTQIPQGTFLGIDPSENMLQLARKELANETNAQLLKADVLQMKFANEFDYIVSFWCLQWCAFAIETAFQNMYRALKLNGKIFALFPLGDDPFITSYYTLKASGTFSCLNQFKPPVDYHHFNKLEERLRALPFKKITVEKVRREVLLPSLDTFRKFVQGIAFFQGQIQADEIKVLNEALVNIYAQECQEQYNNQYKFRSTMYLVQAEKG